MIEKRPVEFGHPLVRLPGSRGNRKVRDVSFVCSACRKKKHYDCYSLKCGCATCYPEATASPAKQ